eukprot:COSAG03_NODE_637_length_6585_cov_2.441721_5_plen_74_part_00
MGTLAIFVPGHCLGIIHHLGKSTIWEWSSGGPGVLHGLGKGAPLQLLCSLRLVLGGSGAAERCGSAVECGGSA